MANFTGFDNVAASGTNPTSPVLTLSFGSTNTSYGTPINFNASISVAAQAPFLMMNAAAFSDLEEQVIFTGFTVENANGQPIPGTATFRPEPSFSMLADLLW